MDVTRPQVKEDSHADYAELAVAWKKLAYKSLTFCLLSIRAVAK